MPTSRSDEDENISRHAAVSKQDCLKMERKYGWKLKRIEELPPSPNQIFQVDCVFQGETEFPQSIYETENPNDA